ncbi:ATP-binding protein, partial [Streptomyces vinaceus]|nr:ATP-binding protein [Streptomyces vinaceus]
ATAGDAPTPLVPRTTPVRGTMGRPQLPRRRAQEHIAPQLRDGPAPRQDSEHVAGHDPQLMAAFQRGISLAESQPGSPVPARPAVPAPRTDHTARHDGSASAG